jgi:uncharacterized repeat protein (TIGR01451 family)
MKYISCKPFHKIAARLLACVMCGALLGACAANRVPNMPEARQPVVSMPPVQQAAPAGITMPPDVRAALDRTPLAFVPNRGQFDARVAFASANRNTALFFTSSGVTWALAGAAPTAQAGGPQRHVITQRFVGANPQVVPTGADAMPTTVNFFTGAPGAWQANLPTFTRVVYADLWPGIDMVYQGTEHGLKYTLIVRPGADLSQIALAYEGASALHVAADGQLAVSTPAGVLHDERPVAFQEVNGQHVGVAVEYALASDGATYGFHADNYDRSRPLLIDPAVPLYSGFIGGAGDDAATAVALDSAGNAYIAGYTYSLESSFPVTSGADMVFNGSVDAFVAKISPDGSRLLYVTYLGGAGFDMANGIAVDGLGNAYVAGQTQSDQTTFPVTVGPRLQFGGGVDGFVAKISPDGAQLQYAGYIGGAGFDSASGIAVDASGSAYVVGQTQSSETSFPVTVGPDMSFNGGVDGFVAKISPDGAQLQYAGYIGGAGSDAAAAVTVDSNGVAYITGSTNSSSSSFPAKNGFDTSYNGGVDAFMAIVSADGAQVLSASYLGGSGYDAGAAIARGPTGTIVIAGQTESDASSFPVKNGPGMKRGGGIDAWVATISADGSALLSAGYIGGDGNDAASGLAVDRIGVIYLTGSTTSTAATFPVRRGPGLLPGGKVDAWLAKVSADGRQLLYAGFMGGSGDDQSAGMAVDSVGNVLLAGFTNSGADSFPLTVGPGQTQSGGYDAFVTRIATNPDLVLTQTAPQIVRPGGLITYTLTITNAATNASPATGVVLTDTLPPGVSALSAAASQGVCSGSSVIRCALGDLDNSAAATVTILATAVQPGTWSNTAVVAANEPDPNPLNNVTTQSVFVGFRTHLPFVVR